MLRPEEKMKSRQRGFMVYRDGRVYFEGKPEELAESKDAYCKSFWCEFDRLCEQKS